MEYHSNCTVISHLWLGSHLCFPIQVSGVPPQHPQRTWGATGLFTNIQRSDVCLKHLKFHQFFLHQKTSEKGEGHEDHEDHGFSVHVVSIPRPSAATTSVMKICGRHMWPQPWHMSHVTFGILFARIFPYWRASMGHDEKRATLSTPKDMENHSRELWLVFQYPVGISAFNKHGSPWTMRCQGRDARGPKTPGGRMRCRAAALRWWFCAKQNQPWLLRARYIIVLLFCWRSISVS